MSGTTTVYEEDRSLEQRTGQVGLSVMTRTGTGMYQTPQSAAMLNLQRSIGNKAVSSLVRSGALPMVVQRKKKVKPTKKSTNIDYDNTQYRVSGAKEDRLVEVVVRRTRDDGTPYYEAIGKVEGFERKMPIVEEYDEPKDLGDWAPRITHINGMGVTPQSGMTSAEALLDSVQGKIAQQDEVAVDQSALDVLFTYSAKRSNIFGDLWDCIKGKTRVEDEPTRSQEKLMLDAIAAKERLHVSAHSRGTIKTDNAVRTVFSILTKQYKPGMRNKGAVKADAKLRAKALEGTGLMDRTIAYEIGLDQAMEIAAQEKAKTDMDQYIQLVYGGNAVSYPSSVIPVELFVGSGDFVSLGVGTYTKAGAKWASGNKRSLLHKQKGGHGYTPNYAKPVGEAIAKDILEKGG